MRGKDLAPLSLVRLRPVSGIKHQLRVHLANVMKSILSFLIPHSQHLHEQLKAPIIGDTWTSRTKPHDDIQKLIPRSISVLPNEPEKGGPPQRMFLHAASVGLTVRSLFTYLSASHLRKRYGFPEIPSEWTLWSQEHPRDDLCTASKILPGRVRRSGTFAIYLDETHHRGICSERRACQDGKYRTWTRGEMARLYGRRRCGLG